MREPKEAPSLAAILPWKARALEKVFKQHLSHSKRSKPCEMAIKVLLALYGVTAEQSKSHNEWGILETEVAMSALWRARVT